MKITHTIQIPRNIFFLCIVGFILRFWLATTIPLTFDEAHNLLLSRSSFFQLRLATLNAYPPLYFSIWHLWQSISINLIWNRLLAVFMGTLSIIITYGAFKKMHSPRLAFITALLTTISPTHMYYTAVARMYAPGILLSTLFCAYVLFFLKKQRLGIGFFLVTLAGLYTHYYFFILWLLAGTWVLIFGHINRQSKKAWIFYTLLISIFLVPLINESIQVNQLIGSVTNPFLKLPAFYFIAQVPWDIAQQLPVVTSSSIDLISLVAVGLGIVNIVILLAIILQLRSLIHFHSMAAAFFVAPLLIWFLLLRGYPIAGLRSFTIFLPCFFYLAGGALAHLKVLNQRFILAITAVLSLSFIFGYVSLYTDAHDDMTNFYKNLSREEVVVYSDIVLYLPTKVIIPQGQHIALHTGYLDPVTVNTLGVNIVPYHSVQPTTSLWYVKQRSNWPPFDSYANTIESYFNQKYHQTKRLEYRNFALIHYETRL